MARFSFKAIFLVIVTTLFFGCPKHRGTALPPIEGLGELPLHQVADFTKTPELASAGYPIVSSEDEVFFFDIRLRQLFKSDLDRPMLRPVGSPGEGPGEYTRIMGLLLEKDHLYVLDARRKIICMDTAGKLVWEEKIPYDFTGLVGKNGDAFYLAERRAQDDGQFMLGLTEWTRDKGARLLCEKPIVTARGYALYEGKLIEGGGIFFLANPVFAMIKNALVVSASVKYEFDISDLDGIILQTRLYGAPAPELTEAMKKSDSSMDLGNYAIAKILPLERGFLAVSNYYLEGKPRIDRYSPSGDLISSHILPFEFNPPSKDVVIQGEYLFYIDTQLTGFQVFRIAY